MRGMRTFLAAAIVLAISTPARGQVTEKIALYADQAGTDCSVADTGVSTVAVYIVHEGTGMRTGCEFRAPMPECWTGATWVGDSWNYSAVAGIAGSSQGPLLQLAYGACRPLPIYLGKMLFEATGASQSCCMYPVLPVAASVISSICDFGEIPILGGSVVINENDSCPCAPPLAAESTTWGRVKSLYN